MLDLGRWICRSCPRLPRNRLIGGGPGRAASDPGERGLSRSARGQPGESEEVGQHCPSIRMDVRVALRVELYAVERAGLVSDRLDRAGIRGCELHEPDGNALELPVVPL